MSYCVVCIAAKSSYWPTTQRTHIRRKVSREKVVNKGVQKVKVLVVYLFLRNPLSWSSDCVQTLRGLSPCASGLRLWCCRLREKRSFHPEGRVSVFWTILNLLGQVTRRQQPLEKDTRVLNLQNKERRTPDSLFPHAWARRCTYLRAIASVNARILGLWSHAICQSGFIHCSHATR